MMENNEIAPAKKRLQPMKKLLLFISAVIPMIALGQITEVRINEVDPDQPATDTEEFIELYGPANQPLDGLVLVLFNGAGDVSYDAYDLDGFSTNAEGFFVLGSSTVPGVGLIMTFNAQGSIQNGSDAIGLYTGDAAAWPMGTMVSGTNLVDAMVYGTEDVADDGLLAALCPGQTQLNDMGNSTNSFSRVPDGGAANTLSAFVVQEITPNASNIPACSGGYIDIVSGDLNQCSDSTNAPIICSNTSLFGSYVYFLTNVNDTILAFAYDGVFNMDTYPDGTYELHGLSFTGNPILTTFETGQPFAAAASDDCYSAAGNVLVITRTTCSADFCAGGTIASSTGNTYISYCLGGESQVITFTASNVGNGDGYLYALTDSAGMILAVLDSNTIDLNTIPIAGDFFLSGVNYYSPLNEATAEIGDTLANIQSVNSCASVSDNSIHIYISNCSLVEGCTRLFFSQYLEGTSNNKALEIYNPTPFPVNLNGYEVYGYSNGSATFSSIVALVGTLQPGDVYMIANSQADQVILDQADVTAGLATFNGNDALVLKYNGDSIDVIGIVGNDPGSAGWQFGDFSLVDHNLIRNYDITSPTTDWALSQGQWTAVGIGDYSGLGSHAAQICSNEAYVTFEFASQLVAEDAGSVSVLIQGYNVLQDVPMTVQLQSETTTQGADWNGTIPVDFTLSPDNTSYTITIDVVDDMLEETSFEYLTLGLIDVNNLATLVNETYTLTIEPSDFSFPLYPIATVTSTQNTIADSLGVMCTVTGIVHGINFNPNGIEFTLIDPTDGIKVFDADENFGYTLQEGDSVIVSGVIDQFMGMVEIYPISIEYVSSGHPLEVPTTLSSLGEDNESHMVRLVCFELVDPTQWTSSGFGFDVDITNGTDTAVMHIDLNTDIFSQDPPAGHFTVVGIGGQMDGTDPYDSDYQFWPRSMSDYSDEVVAAFLAPTEVIFNDLGASVPFVNQSIGGTEYTWDFGDGNSSFVFSPTHDYSYSYLSGVTDAQVTLSITSPLGCKDETEATIPVIYSSIEEAVSASIRVYPNPAVEFVNVRSADVIREIHVINMNGQMMEQMRPNQSQVTLAVDSWAVGIYVIEVVTENGLYREQVSVR
jgi:hypothetical protein